MWAGYTSSIDLEDRDRYFLLPFKPSHPSILLLQFTPNLSLPVYSYPANQTYTSFYFTSLFTIFCIEHTSIYNPPIMHFSTAALFALSTLSLTSAAPFAGPQEDLYGRKVDYEVVNVGGESSSAAPEIDIVTETVKSVVTAPGAAPAPMTITVTATPSSTPYSSAAPSSTPSHAFAPGGSSFFPPGTGFLRRGLNAAGDPYYFARSYSPSASSTSSPVSATSLAARGYAGWASSATPSSSSASVSTSLAARQFGGWYSSAPSFSSATPSVSSMSVSATPLVAREWSAASSSASYAARDYAATSSSVAWSFTPSSTPLARRAIRNQAWSSAASASSSSYSLSPSTTPLLY